MEAYLESPEDECCEIKGARAFCTVRGTPLLLQLWLIYFGHGSLFSQSPWIRETELWPYLREAWPYALLALTLSFAATRAT